MAPSTAAEAPRMNQNRGKTGANHRTKRGWWPVGGEKERDRERQRERDRNRESERKREEVASAGWLKGQGVFWFTSSLPGTRMVTANVRKSPTTQIQTQTP